MSEIVSPNPSITSDMAHQTLRILNMSMNRDMLGPRCSYIGTLSASCCPCPYEFHPDLSYSMTYRASLTLFLFRMYYISGQLLSQSKKSGVK